ncbi:MAG: pilin [bacterium]
MTNLTKRILRYSKVAIVALVFFCSLVAVGQDWTAQALDDPVLGKTLGDSGLSANIPDCSDFKANPNCKDVSIFVLTLIKVSRYIFSIVGGLALIMFVYGGLTWILSRGNAEKMKKGLEIFTAAIVGLIIIFSAYMLVSYLGTSLGVGDQFRLQ